MAFGNTPVYTRFIRPALFTLPPETAHHQLMALAKACPKALYPLLQTVFSPPASPRLSQSLLGQTFQHPVGLAAGFDKNAEILEPLQAVGFAYAEVGSISAQPSPGNPQPRIFRLPEDQAIINRMGLNNQGVQAIQDRLQNSPEGFPLGISLSKTHDPSILGDLALKDYETTLQGVYGLGAYLSLNISCPNTQEGKTFEEPEALAQLLEHLRAVEAECTKRTQISPRPWLLKVSPDLSEEQLREIFEIGTAHGVAGWVATNTSRSRSGLHTEDSKLQAIGMGGLSGSPVREKSTQILGTLYQWGQDLSSPPILIGVGGIMDGPSAWEKITHGANLLQVYTGLIYQGPGLLKEICAYLETQCQTKGYTHISQAIGSAFKA